VDQWLSLTHFCNSFKYGSFIKKVVCAKNVVGENQLTLTNLEKVTVRISDCVEMLCTQPKEGPSWFGPVRGRTFCRRSRRSCIRSKLTRSLRRPPTRAVRRRRRAAADILLTPPPPIVTDRRAAAAAADRMSASRRCRFRDVFTSCCTPATCC